MADRLKLWHISQSANNNYDTYDSAVVVAADEESARTIHPDGSTKWDGVWYRVRIDGTRYESSMNFSDWTLLENVTARLVGEATSDITEGSVVCASFNAG